VAKDSYSRIRELTGLLGLTGAEGGKQDIWGKRELWKMKLGLLPLS
jgi:hypothetical protein